MSVIKFRSLFLALFVFTASGYGQAEQTEPAPKCETPTIKGDPACWMKAEKSRELLCFGILMWATKRRLSGPVSVAGESCMVVEK